MSEPRSEPLVFVPSGQSRLLDIVAGLSAE
jgi:hypothetical protein